MRGVLLGILLALAAQAVPQVTTETVGDYESRFGKPTSVSLDELVQASAEFQGRAVRTKGRLGMPTGVGVSGYVLRDLGAQVLIAPMAEVSPEFEDHARRWMGHQIEVVGVLEPVTEASPQTTFSIRFWQFDGPRDSGKAAKPRDSSDVGLGGRDGETIRVVGQFCGRNLCGDLPVSPEPGPRDWVLKGDSHVVWVTGRDPKGKGWALDPLLKSDTGRWLEVVGRLETRNGVPYLRARKVTLTTAPPLPPE